MANNQTTINEEAGLGPEWVPVDAPPIIPGKTPPAPGVAYSESSKYLQGSIPQSFQLSPDFVNTQVESSSVPNFSLMPLGVQGNPVSNAGVQSTVTKVVQNTSPGVTIEVNGVNIPNQRLLNLTGAGVTTDNTGDVVFTSGGGDGLTHGETPWESDPSFFNMRDDFYSSTGSTTGTLGDLKWGLLAATGTIGKNVGTPKNPGNLLIYPGAGTASVGASIFQPASVSSVNWDSSLALLDTPGWKCEWVFCLQRPFIGSVPQTFDITKMSMYVGLANDANLTSGTLVNRPAVFMGVRYDTDTTAPSIGDTTFWLEACFNGIHGAYYRTNAQGTLGGAVNTGITPVEGVYYRLTMSCAASGTVVMSLNGGGNSFSNTFTLTPFTSVLTSGLQVTESNGTITFAGTPAVSSNTVGFLATTPGSKITVSGLTGGLAVYNLTYTVTPRNTSTGFVPVYHAALGAPGVPGASYNLTGFQPVFPFAALSNDTAGSAPTASNRALWLDFFSLVWNPALSSAGGTPNSSLARYW